MLLFSHVLLHLLAISFATARSLQVEAPTNLIRPKRPTNITFTTPLLNFSASVFPRSPASSGAGNVAATKRVPRFAEIVYDAVVKTTARWPRAVFVEADATSATGPTTNPDELTDVRLIFSYNVGQYRSILLTMEAWGQWSEPYPTNFVPAMNTGPMPLSLGMDLVEADALLKAAGYIQEYDAVDVKWPTNYQSIFQQVYYFFQLEARRSLVVAVGARDGSVTPAIGMLKAADRIRGDVVETA